MESTIDYKDSLHSEVLVGSYGITKKQLRITSPSGHGDMGNSDFLQEQSRRC